MRFVPSQPDAQSPTWEIAFGLFSFQIVAVLVSSVMIAIIPRNPTLSIVVSGALTVFAAFLYGLVAESQASGAIRNARFRMLLALRAASLTAIVALLTMVAFRLIEVKIAVPSRNDLYLLVYLWLGVLVVPWLEMWMGLSVVTWLRGHGSRS